MRRVLLAAFLFCFAAAAQSQSFPQKPIRLLVGFSAGGPTDVIARIIAQDLTASLGQPVLVENKAGAASMIATQEVKRSAADGYTLYMTTLTHSVNAILHADKKPYDPIEDFTPVTLVCHLPLVMVAKGDSPFNSAADVVKAAKAKPGEISYASSGNGGSAHLAGALGVPTWVLLPLQADWRWMEEREDTPWYPTMRLFRQSRDGDWESVIARVARELRRRFS